MLNELQLFLRTTGWMYINNEPVEDTTRHLRRLKQQGAFLRVHSSPLFFRIYPQMISNVQQSAISIQEAGLVATVSGCWLWWLATRLMRRMTHKLHTNRSWPRAIQLHQQHRLAEG
ncbi:hypothetical protein Vafri_11197 [Volvox africanus]|nr:hypothetical protein Vafri_11197 [Volvox africanus]